MVKVLEKKSNIRKNYWKILTFSVVLQYLVLHIEDKYNRMELKMKVTEVVF